MRVLPVRFLRELALGAAAAAPNLQLTCPLPILHDTILSVTQSSVHSKEGFLRMITGKMLLYAACMLLSAAPAHSPVPVVEDASAGQHSVKYYSYQPSAAEEKGDFFYYDVLGRRHIADLHSAVPRHNYYWPAGTANSRTALTSGPEGVPEVTAPAGYRMLQGIDVSKHNGVIDWNKVRASGIDFAFIRIAYRGYGSAGSLREDEMARENLLGAKAAGLKVGVYIFSQAVNESEAVEEADFVLGLLRQYSASGLPLDLPVIFDPETIRNDVARTDNVTGEQFTENALAFCSRIKEAGYEAGIYSNMIWEDYYFDLSELTEYPVWYADYGSLPQTPYQFTWWQYTEKGHVDGVENAVDRNVWFLPIQ